MSYLLVIWFFLPSFLMVVFSFPSLAIGLVATSLAAMLLTLSLNLKSQLRIGRPYLVILMAAAFSILLSHFLAQQPFSSKQGLSLASLVILAFGASTSLQYFFSRGITSVSKSVKKTFWLLVVGGLIGIILPLRVGPYANAAQPVFPFIEPSHYALAYGQITAITLPFLKRKARLFVVSASFLLAFLLPNTTMLVTAFLLLMVTASIRSIMFTAMAFGTLAFFITTMAPDFFSYFTDRLTGSESENLSRLVYIQGWENFISAMTTTDGLGIGFQNLGNEPPGEATEIISRLTDESTLNRADGGFLFAKLGGEFGVVGVAAALSLLALAILAGIRIRREFKFRLNAERALAIIPLCSTYVVIVEMLIRGMGYFSPSLILTIFFIPQTLYLLRNKTANSLQQEDDLRRDQSCRSV